MRCSWLIFCIMHGRLISAFGKFSRPQIRKCTTFTQAAEPVSYSAGELHILRGFATRRTSENAELTFHSRPSTELLTVPMYAVACVFVVITSIMADRQKTRFRYMMLDLILCFFGLIINRE